MLDNTSDSSLATWFRDNAQKRLGRDYIYESFDGCKTALVVVDMQNYFMKPGFLAACPMAIEVVPAINQLAENIRQQEGAVVWVQTTSAPEATKDWGVYQELFSPENWQRRNVELAEDHEGYALWPELNVAEDDLFVNKSRFSAFIPGASDIDAQLKNRGIENLLIAGVATGVCCEATARDAMMLNYRVTMAADALAAMSIEGHENALKALYGMFCDVQTGDEISQKLK